MVDDYDPLLPIGVHSTTARTEGRFRQHFGADGSVTPEIQSTQDDRLASWHSLQELAGVLA